MERFGIARRRWWIAAGAALALVAGAARAGDEAPEPPSVERTTPPVEVEEVLPAELPDDPSAFTTVIRPDEFEGEEKRVVDLLEYAPGVQVRRFGGPGAQAEASIRGSTGSQVVVLLDGVPLNTAQSGTVDLSTIPAELLDRIEVTRGGGSVQSGSGAIGGVIHLISKRPDARPQTTLRGAGGSFGTWQGSASQTGRLGDFEIALGYDAFHTDGDFRFQAPRIVVDGVPLPDPVDSAERVNNETENHSGLLRVGRDLGEHWRLTASDAFFYGSSGEPGLALSGGENLGQSLDGHLRRTRNAGQVHLEGADLGPTGLDGSLRVFHRYDRSHFSQDDDLCAVDTDNRNHAAGGRVGVEQPLAWAGVAQRASVGVEVREDWLRAKHGLDPERLSTGVFLQDEIGFFDDRVQVIPALRFDATEGFDDEWIPRIGVVVQPLPWLRFQGNLERSYRVPTFDELYFDQCALRGNPGLRPEDAVGADVGFRLGFERILWLEDVHFEFAAFRNDIDNTIVFQLVSQSVSQATNTGKARSQGIELAGGLRLLGWVGFFANLTLLDTHVKDSGGPIPGRPDTAYLLRVDLGPPGGLFKLVGERHYTGSIPLAPGGNSVMSSSVVYDTSLVVDLAQLPFWPERLRTRRLAFSVVATNVTDRSVLDARGFPEPGRSLLFGVEGQW